MGLKLLLFMDGRLFQADQARHMARYRLRERGL
jgi:hypothetical protein